MELIELGSQENLLKTYDIATDTEIEAGKDWYLKANQWCSYVAEATEVPLDIVINVLAQLSPNNRWERNKQDTLLTIRSWQDGIKDPKEIPCATYNNNVWCAIKILEGTQQGVTGTKVTSFAHNIRFPETVLDDMVTIDMWAIRAWIWDSRREIKRTTDKLVRACAVDYQEAAAKVRQVPRDFQAIVWLAVRRAGSYGYGNANTPCKLEALYRQMSLF